MPVFFLNIKILIVLLNYYYVSHILSRFMVANIIILRIWGYRDLIFRCGELRGGGEKRQLDTFLTRVEHSLGTSVPVWCLLM